MTRARDKWADNTSVFLVVELVYGRSKGTVSVSVLTSAAGKEEPAERTWLLPKGSLTPTTATDLAGHVEQRVMDSLVTFVGVQGLLPT